MKDKKEIEFISVKTTAELLDCTIQFIYHLISTGELKAIKLGTQAIRISMPSLTEYIESRWIDPASYRCGEANPEVEKPQRIITPPAQSNWMKRT